MSNNSSREVPSSSGEGTFYTVDIRTDSEKIEDCFRRLDQLEKWCITIDTRLKKLEMMMTSDHK